MAPRPRGGWQTSQRLLGRQRVGVYGDQPDPSPDVSSVTREADGVFLVHHFPTADAKKPCCRVRVTQRAGESDVEALLRASVLCDRQHAVPAEAIA